MQCTQHYLDFTLDLYLVCSFRVASLITEGDSAHERMGACTRTHAYAREIVLLSMQVMHIWSKLIGSALCTDLIAVGHAHTDKPGAGHTWLDERSRPDSHSLLNCHVETPCRTRYRPIAYQRGAARRGHRPYAYTRGTSLARSSGVGPSVRLAYRVVAVRHGFGLRHYSNSGQYPRETQRSKSSGAGAAQALTLSSLSKMRRVGMPALSASLAHMVAPRLLLRIKARQTSAPVATISALRTYPARLPQRSQSAG